MYVDLVRVRVGGSWPTGTGRWTTSIGGPPREQCQCANLMSERVEARGGWVHGPVTLSHVTFVSLACGVRRWRGVGLALGASLLSLHLGKAADLKNLRAGAQALHSLRANPPVFIFLVPS